MINAIIIGHGDFAQAMLRTAESIVGEQENVEVVSNKGFSCEQLGRDIERRCRNRERDTIIFLDLPGGSCTITCYTLLKSHHDLNIISGVNLPLLIEFFMLRNKYSARDLVSLLVKKGKDNIIHLRCRDEG
jgi:mannose/fructose/sorbose-specific phosphotransferase system IIA component